MTIRLMLAGTALICGLSATQAFAGSPYSSDATTTASGAGYGAVTTDEAPVVATPRTRHAAVATTPASPLGADGYLPVEKIPYGYNHAEGTMGSP